MANNRSEEPECSTLASAPLPRRGERVLVVAPHPDDESLGTGGLIHEAARRGAEVRVAYLTSGDGFPLAAAAHFRRWPDQKVLRRLAEVRRGEAVRALRHLGVGEEAAIFLGYPDRGLAPLWLSAGEDPFPPGKSSPGGKQKFRGDAPTRRTLLTRLDQLLEEVRPDYLFYPDPADDHPDHWAAYCFLRLVLESRRLRGCPAPHAQRTYLIHRGCWPRPLQERPDLALTPPAELTGVGVRWEELPLSGETLAAKRQALGEHRTQQRLVGNFFRGFVRRTELFSRWDEPGSGDERGGDTVRLRDPVADRFGRARWGGADVVEMEVHRGRSGEAGGAVVLHLRGPVRAGLDYRFYWVTVLSDPTQALVRTVHLRTGGAGSQSAPSGRCGSGFRVVLPPESHGAPLLVAAEVWLGAVLFERTPWRIVPAYQSPPSSTC